MAVVNVKSSAVTNADATPRVPNNSFVGGGDVGELVGTAEVTNGDSIGSTYRLGRIPSGARISGVELFNDSCGAACTGDVGIYKNAADGGAVVSAALFGSAIDLNTAHGSAGPLDVTYEATATNIDKIEKRLWELAGLSLDPYLEYDVVITLVAAAAASGTVCVRVRYVY
jgi:hypothetical protein